MAWMACAIAALLIKLVEGGEGRWDTQRDGVVYVRECGSGARAWLCDGWCGLIPGDQVRGGQRQDECSLLSWWWCHNSDMDYV